MQLLNFSVTNFRSITSAHKINLDCTTVLIGKNNEGKSNLLKALQVAMQLLQDHALNRNNRDFLHHRIREENYFWNRDFPINLQERTGPRQTIFRLEFLLDDTEIADFKERIGSNLNGSLPLEIRVGQRNKPEIHLKKPGKNTKTLAKKSNAIAKFVAEKIYFNYIPAVRTDKEAMDIIGRMLAQELKHLENDPDYKAALNTLEMLQRPVLETLSTQLEKPLAEFLPSIKSVKIEMESRIRRTFGYGRNFEVIVDDGTPTSLEYKGDGVKSLVALALLKNKRKHRGASIVAIEEPESHLHPGAIHQLNDIISAIGDDNQVIITTHNPLFVNRSVVKANIIVNAGSAKPAKKIEDIRLLLGIKASDNLTNASYVLVVEGKEDASALKALLPTLSSEIKDALKEHVLVVDYIGGAGNLSYKLSLLRNALCEPYVLLDNDKSGVIAFEKAVNANLASIKNTTMVTCPNMDESEFEDCLDPSLYKNLVLKKFGVDLSIGKFKSSEKWSSRIRAAFVQQGKPFNDRVLQEVKFEVATAVEVNPNQALNSHKRGAIDALVSSLENLLTRQK